MDVKRLISKGLRELLQPPAITDCKVDKNAAICSGSHVNYSSIDRYSYIGHDCFVLNANIGPFVSIADNCRIGGANHDYSRVSLSPVFQEGKNVLRKNISQFPSMSIKKINIGPDVWIAANSIVLSGVSIGAGAIIGTGSVVTKDVPPYEIWVGNPAHKISDRFDDSTKKELLLTRWWDWEYKDICDKSVYFNDPIVFIEKCKQSKEQK